ncbi:unnamed protein product [Acanthoscelides obtectus]|uniref:Uncharacterized protein n=1 Tax=Acanthoscelides obtectus TaxID=200917 RepID=A0A9P0JYN6_ACAOB|nr:unnamed protein product [Acanthoscelides obtectus]CAK1668937.1 hypothetical protein AOBTE_LOCUS26700 [Acanthoscelides obtectus]
MQSSEFYNTKSKNVIRYNRIIGSSETSNHKLSNSAIESTIMLVKVIFLQMRQRY